MSLINSEMNDLSREELYSVINQMKRQINCLETDLIKSQYFQKSYEKYFNYFNEINENISSNNKILDLIKRLKVLKQLNENSLKCCVSAKKLSENDFNDSNVRQFEVFNRKNLGSNDVSTQTDDIKHFIETKYFPNKTLIKKECKDEYNEEVVPNNDNQITESNVRQIQDFNRNDVNTRTDDKQHIIESKYFSDKTLFKNESQDNEEVVLNNDNEIISEDNTNLESKIITKSIDIQLDDNDSDYDIKDQKISDNSDEDWNESQSKIKSTKSPTNGSFFCTQEECSRSFQSANGLRVHLSIVHKIRSRLSKSIDYSTNESFICTFDDCGRSFTSHKGLRTHHASVHQMTRNSSSNDNSEKVFCCVSKDCSAVFATKRRLNRHQLIHSRQYMCNVLNCGHTSGLYSLLLKHRRKSHPKEMPFQCCLNECDNSFKSQQLLTKHQTNDHNIGCQQNASSSTNGSFHCRFDNCSRSLKSYAGLKVHEGLHKRKESNVYRCDFEGCSFYTQCPDTHNQHMFEHLGRYSCNVEGCHHISGSNSGLKIHKQRMHSNESPFKCTQKDCDKSFKTFNDLRKHLKTHPISYETLFVCEHSNCGKVFRMKHFLEKHQINYHSKNSTQKYMCDHNGCGKRYKNSETLKEHKKLHLGLVFQCNWKDCSRLFSSKIYLNRHLVKHKGIYRCKWSGCQFNGSSVYALKLHKAIHFTQKQFKCRFNGCDKQFRIAKQREWHYLRAHPNEFSDVPWIQCKDNGCKFKTKSRAAIAVHNKQVHPPHTYACEWFGCETVYKEKSKLKDHMNVHTGDKTYRCDWPGCDKTFTMMCSLSSHRSKHKTRNHFKCQLCDFRSASVELRDRHMKTHENQIN